MSKEEIKREFRKPATHRKYTEGFKNEIRQARADGMMRKEIADKYGLSLKVVEHILYDKPILLVGTKGKELSERETKWFISHYKNTRNDEIQVKLNITYSALHRLARQYGLKKTRQFMKKTQAEATEKARQSWEREKKMNTAKYKRQIELMSENLKLNDPDNKYKFRKGESNKDRLSPKKFKIMMENIHTKLEELRSRDKRRKMMGLKPLTNLGTGESKSKKYVRLWNVRYRLRKTYGYEIEPGSMEVRYTDKTKRSEQTEKYYSKKYGFRFIPEGGSTTERKVVVVPNWEEEKRYESGYFACY